MFTNIVNNLNDSMMTTSSWVPHFSHPHCFLNWLYNVLSLIDPIVFPSVITDSIGIPQYSIFLLVLEMWESLSFFMCVISLTYVCPSSKNPMKIRSGNNLEPLDFKIPPRLFSVKDSPLGVGFACFFVILVKDLAWRL